MNDRVHQQIESLAGAIALGEATDGDRRFYREHLAACESCRSELGGEHELVRTAETIAQARDAEIWQPHVSPAFASRSGAWRRAVPFAAAFTLTLAGAAAMAHWISPPNPPSDTVVSQSTIALRASAPARMQNRNATPQRLVVYHKVVQLARSPVASRPQNDNRTPEIAEMTVFPRIAPVKKNTPNVSSQPPAWRTVARTTTTAFTETAPERVSSAESMRLDSAFRTAVSHEATPIGGETAINPQPPMIAYAEQIEGTTVYEVIVDDRGAPQRCVITKPSGYRFLDDAVCNAAMHARFFPRILAGRAVQSVYHDAFTFRSTPEASDGLPNPIVTPHG